MGSMFLRSLFRIQPMYARSPHIVANERNIVHIAGQNQDAHIVQIADQQVNRIDCYVRPGDRVVAGQKIGMISRGSQVDLFLPASFLQILQVLPLVRRSAQVPAVS